MKATSFEYEIYFIFSQFCVLLHYLIYVLTVSHLFCNICYRDYVTSNVYHALTLQKIGSGQFFSCHTPEKYINNCQSKCCY